MSRHWSSSPASAISIGTRPVRPGPFQRNAWQAWNTIQTKTRRSRTRYRQPSTQKNSRPAQHWHSLSLTGPERLQRIGENLYDIDRLAKAIEEYRLRQQPLHAAVDVTPGSTLETALANIWRKVLGRPQIGINDNFFEAGGTSLRAVQVIAMIKKELKQSLSIVSLFECPTVTLLAAKLSAASGAAHGETTTAAAALRGQQRRYNTIRRKAS